MYVYRERKENLRILKLEPWVEYPSTILFKSIGDPTKRGEVLASRETHFGFFIVEWVAPCDGVVADINESGMIAISPTDPNAPFFPYPAHMAEMEKRSEENVLQAIEEAKELKKGPINARMMGLDQERRRTRYAQKGWSEWVSYSRPASDEKTSVSASAAYGAPTEITELPVIAPMLTKLKPLWIFLIVLTCYGYLYYTAGLVRTTYYLSQAVLIDLKDTVVYQTSLSFLDQHQVRNTLGGRLQQVHVEDGDFVREGQPLLTFANTSYSEALLPALQNLNQARQQYDTQLLLSQASLGSDSAGYLALLQQRSTTSQLVQSAENLVIRAPAAGRITTIESLAGTSLRAGEALFGYHNSERVTAADREVQLLRLSAALQAAEIAAGQLRINAPHAASISSISVEAGDKLMPGELLLTIRQEEPVNESTALQVMRLQQQIEQSASLVDSLAIKATTSGRISGFKAVTGDYFTAGSVIATIGNPSDNFIRVAVPQTQISGIAIGNAAEVTLSHNNRLLSGTVYSIGEGQTNQTNMSVSFPVEIRLEYGGEPQNGMSATVAVTRERPDIKTSPLRGTVEQRGTVLRTQAAGELVQSFVQNGDTVAEGQTIALLINAELLLAHDRLQEQLNALLRTELRTSATAEVLQVHVFPGDRVEAGQLLVTLGNGVVEANLQKAREDYDLLSTEMVATEMIRVVSPGTLAEIMVSEGDWVAKGQTLATLANPDLTYQMAMAENTLTRMEAEVAASALNPGASNLARAALNLQQAEQRLALVEANMASLTVTAPASGIISFKQSLYEGLDYSANQLLAAINGTGIGLHFYVEESYQQDLKTGLPVAVELISFPEDLFWGEVISVDNVGTVTPEGRVYFGASVLLEDDERLFGGMTATAWLILREAKDAIAIPINCLKQSVIDDEVVYTVQRVSARGSLVESPVQVGMITRYAVEITDGLREGEMVATFLGIEETDVTGDIERLINNFRDLVMRFARAFR